MAEKLLKAKKRKIVPSSTGRAASMRPPQGAAASPAGRAASMRPPRKVILVGTYAGDQLKVWPGYYPYPLYGDDKIDAAPAKKVNEIWLFKGTKEPRYFAAECLGVKTRDELKALGYPAKGKGHGDGMYLLFKIEKTYAPANASAALAASVESVIIRTKDFAKRSPKVAKQLKAYLESPDRKDAALANQLPTIVTKLPPQILRVCEAGWCSTSDACCHAVQKFEVLLSVTLQKIFVIEASDEESAEKILEERWLSNARGAIRHDDLECVDVQFDVIGRDVK